MKQQATQAVSVNFPILGILTVLFIAFKLTHVIAWSWLWVLAPSWIPLAIFLGILGIIGICAVIVAAGS